MPTIAISSDLHFDLDGYLTSPDEVTAVARAMRGARPDAVVLAGDIGHPLENFTACIDLFADWEIPVGVVAGNHDVWRDASYNSRELWEDVLPRMTRLRNCTWLELDSIVLGDTVIVGSIGWYDYSAVEPSLNLTPSYLQKLKPRVSNDARWLNWPWLDIEFSEMIREQLVGRLRQLENDSSVSQVILVTHVPLFEEQMERDPFNIGLSVCSAYFGNLCTGRVVAEFSKVKMVVSGHLHQQRQAVVSRDGMEKIQTLVVGSDYGKPAWILVEI